MPGPLYWARPATEPVPKAPGQAHVRGGLCRTTAALFTEWATALNFPDYFGHNWDAFADSLKTEAWGADIGVTSRQTPDPLTVIIHRAPALLAEEPPAVLLMFADIIDGIATGRLVDRTRRPPANPRLELLLLDDWPQRPGSLIGRLAATGLGEMESSE
jgi:hypothetical protein